MLADKNFPKIAILERVQADRSCSIGDKHAVECGKFSAVVTDWRYKNSELTNLLFEICAIRIRHHLLITIGEEPKDGIFYFSDIFFIFRI